ncbi:MAG: GSU2086 family protein [Candidatus Xenobia bacterium]
MPYDIAPLDLSLVRTYPLGERRNKVREGDFARVWEGGGTLARFIDSLPEILAARDLKAVARAIAEAVRQEQMVLLFMGAHVLKVGLAPILIDLLERGVLRGIALNGAGIVHDVEVALVGQTSEDVAAGIKAGTFGMVTETGVFLNSAAEFAAREGIGLGEAVGRCLHEAQPDHVERSLLAAAWRCRVPVTVHLAIGGDINHTHPNARGEHLGAATFHDFRLLCGLMAQVRPGAVLLNVGSAVVLPVVMEKAIAVARNLGHAVEGFTGVNMDFHQHYRSNLNPVSRAKELGGHGFALTGHHEIMVPLLAAAVLEDLAGHFTSTEEAATEAPR